jgi:PLD-like domain
MNEKQTIFLGDPGAIRREIHSLASASKKLDLAVAFIGPEWHRLLANFAGPIRAICWLNHPATDPDAVKSLMTRENSVVKQRNGLHTKVYLAPGLGAVVGSANLSRPALTQIVGLPQCEAAVSLYDEKRVQEIGKWFNSLWRDQPQTREISDNDLERAKKEREKWPIQVAHTLNHVNPPPKTFPIIVKKLARQVENIELMETLGKYHDQVVKAIAKPQLASTEIAKLADSLASWTKHRAVYQRFEKQPANKTLRGLRTLLDEGRDIQDRLHEIRKRRLLKGLQIPAMSLLLYWWRPDSYPPFNAKTKRFLKDFNMASHGMSASSPDCYATWLGFADLLRARLQLPTVGHVDRLVSRYYDTVQP